MAVVKKSNWQYPSFRLWLTQLFCVGLVVIFLLLVPRSAPQNTLQTIRNEGVLRVGVRLGPLTYFERDGVPSGMDYNILASFADELGVGLEFELFEKLENQLQALDAPGGIHMAAATLATTNIRVKNYQFSRPYMEVDTVLIQHTARERRQNLQKVIDENRNIVVIEDSAHAELLQQLKPVYPNLTWQEEPGTIMFQLMERVQNEELDMAVIDSSLFDLEASLFPNVEVAVTLKKSDAIAFALPQSNDSSFVDELDNFLDRYESSGVLDDLLLTYLDPEPSIDVAGSMVFNERIKERLPTYEDLFRSVAEENDYSWVLLAAQAYQESHWNAKAKSPTGVRGLMMLTLPTAKELGVKSRLDPIESLEGGMRFLLQLKKRLPDSILKEDRNKFALAAYNVGYGHLQDARILAERDGADPNQWEVVKQYLPLLRQRKYYSTVKYGYARGSEPVGYVNNIYRYANILEWHDWQKELEAELALAAERAKAKEREESNDNEADNEVPHELPFGP